MSYTSSSGRGLISGTPSACRQDPPLLVVADLDGTLLHDAPIFEERFITQKSVDAVRRLKDHGVLFAVSTARPVSTGYSLMETLQPDACVYLNGALIDLKPSLSDRAMLMSGLLPQDAHIMAVGFPSSRGCEVCRMLLHEIPDLRIGLVINDVRYTNFDVSVYWKTQVFRYTDFTDVPEGMADKIIIFPLPEHVPRLRELIPDDFSVGISEGTMWMLMEPRANKADSLHTLCRHFSVDMNRTATFGDDLIDIAMLKASGWGVAVANAAPQVLTVADEVCPSNNDDGVAWWMNTVIP